MLVVRKKDSTHIVQVFHPRAHVVSTAVVGCNFGQGMGDSQAGVRTGAMDGSIILVGLKLKWVTELSYRSHKCLRICHFADFCRSL